MNNRRLIFGDERYLMPPLFKGKLKSPPLKKGDLGGFEVFALKAVR